MFINKNLFSFIIVLVLFCACKENLEEVQKAGIQQENYTRVKVAPVSLSNDPIPIHLIGKVASDKEIKLSFKIGGIITAINADEGDYVQKGKRLASIRTDEIDAQVLKAQRALQKAERDLERIEKMYADSAATLENVQDLTTLVQVTKADLDVATFNQEYAKIVSPVSGRIIRRMAEPNELVSPGQPVFMVSSNNQTITVVKASISDKDLNRVNYNDPAAILFDAFPGDTLSGKLIQIAENADPMTGTFELEIAVNATGKRLRNGYVGRIMLLPRQQKHFYKIPISAVVEGNKNKLKIFIPHNDTIAKEIEVIPFYITSDFIAVNKNEALNLKKVITAGAPYLTNGDRIKIQ